MTVLQAPAIRLQSKAREKKGLSSEHYQHELAQMAYYFWEERGRPEGSPEQDWSRAEAAMKPLWSADVSFQSAAGAKL